ncbi:hypothetical protein EGW08_003293 [Elysia chlorotica]|uniref:Secreted protein n=1 Tax=Elysia chlorotica TaxID=188477 RepID=A0A3S1BQB9_ELYCH|nr:hypothetical protein EGW08_003293 [Elysia chlorotica]
MVVVVVSLVVSVLPPLLLPPSDWTTPARRLKLHWGRQVVEHTDRSRPHWNTLKMPATPLEEALQVENPSPHLVAHPSTQPHAAAQAILQAPLSVLHKLPKSGVKPQVFSWIVHWVLHSSAHGVLSAPLTNKTIAIQTRNDFMADRAGLGWS